MTPKSLACLVLVALPCLAIAQAAVSAEGSWVPTPDAIRELEQHLTLGPSPPKSSRPPFTTLTSHDVSVAARFYYGQTYEGARVIQGEILRGGDGKPGVTIQADMPIVMDGGCLVINLLYDVERRQFIRFECNGLA